jgi:hypothetical protein
VNARAAEVAIASAAFLTEEIDIGLLVEFVGFSLFKFTVRGCPRGEAGGFTSF